MKKFLICFLLILITILADNTFGVYAAPDEATVVVCGGLGTMANASDTNGGGATKAVWDAGSPSDFINTNGGPITNDTTCTYTHIGTTIAKTGIGTGVTIGTLAYVVKDGGVGNLTTGIYEITAVPDGDTITVADIDADGDCTVTVNVGGAFASLQGVYDNAVNDAVNNTIDRYIYINGVQSDNDGTITITAPVDIDQQSGDTKAFIWSYAYNDTLAATSEIIMETTSDIASLITLDGDKDSYKWIGFTFNAGGKDATRAEYCVLDTGGNSTANTFIDCRFYGAEIDGVKVASGHYWDFINCEFYLNGGMGLNYTNNDGDSSRVFGCSFHDNDSHGIQIGGPDQTVQGCKLYDNGKDGTGNGLIVATGGSFLELNNNTSYGNATSGYDLSNFASGLVVFNNTAVGNGTYGYNLRGDAGRCSYFAYNHSNGNVTAHYSEGADGTFAAFRDGSNRTGAPNFTNTGDGTEDFTPTSGSDLINNALEFGGIGTLDIGAVQEASGDAGGGQPVMGGGIVR